MIIRDFDKTAIIYGEQTISYSSLINNINFFCDLYLIQKGDRVIIFGENRPEWIYAFYSVWYNGGASVAVDYLSSADELSYIIKDCEPRVIFCSSINRQSALDGVKQSGLNLKVIVLDEVVCGQTTKRVEIERDTEETAVLIYTSGTTGSPKGVMLSFKNIYANIEGIMALRMFEKPDRFAVILPFHHIYPLTGTVVLPLLHGITLVIIEKLSSDVILAAFQKHKMTILFGVPRLYNLFHKAITDKIKAKFITRALFNLCRKLNSRGLSRTIFKKVHKLFGSHVRFFLTGGSKINQNVTDDFRTLGFTVTEGYGLSETSPLNTANNSPGVYRTGSIGKPLFNVEAKIVDNEIVVKGDHVMKGYYNKPKETAEVLKDGWFYTGDEGYIDEDGFVFITGRKKELLVLPNGKKINPEEIESKILEISPDLVKEIGVFVKDSQLFALILPNFENLKKNYMLNIMETVKWQILDNYNKAARDFKKVFNFQIVNEELPKTRLGKLKRFVFPQLSEAKNTVTEHKADPDNGDFRIIKKYLSEVTGGAVYIDSHIELDLGLDSLGKIEFQSFIENTFGIVLSNEDLVSNYMLSDLVDYISERKTKNETEEINWEKILNEDINIKVKSRPFFSFIAKFIILIFGKIYFLLGVRGKKNLPKSPFIFAPNHESFLDPFLIAASLPGKVLKNTYFLANDKHFKKNFNAFIGKSSNILTVDINRNLKISLQKIAHLIKHKKNIVIFPEGARSRDGSLMDFKKTFSILSKVLNVPVVPVCIDGSGHSFPIGKKFPRPGKIRVSFLDPIYPEELDLNSITNKTREAIASVLDMRITKK